jgi:hypothetical protein
MQITQPLEKQEDRVLSVHLVTKLQVKQTLSGSPCKAPKQLCRKKAQFRMEGEQEPHRSMHFFMLPKVGGMVPVRWLS